MLTLYTNAKGRGMANADHVAKLSRGTTYWNQWRSEAGDIVPDLSTADLSALNLRGANLTGANLSGAKMHGVVAAHANFSSATLHRTELQDSKLAEAKFVGADCDRANFFAADLSNADLNTGAFTGVTFAEAKLKRVRAQRSSFCEADLSHSDLSDGNFTDADLSEAELIGANLNGAVLVSTRFAAAVFGGTLLARTSLRSAMGLEHVVHSGPSSVDVFTLAASGDLPLTFTRGCGLPQAVIEYLPSLLASPIQFYSCFISYSDQDREFAKRLYADLQAAGVRCWYAPKDLRIGDKFRARIDESIRVYDRLLLILSDRSIDSSWVEKEVETAFEKERSRRTTVLFPIRIDDSVFQTMTPWAADLRRTRHIGDFRDWKDHNHYREAFRTLLRDLRNSQTGGDTSVAHEDDDSDIPF